jgi:hypothetical protein
MVVTTKLLAEIGEMERMTTNEESVFDAIKRGTWPSGEIPFTYLNTDAEDDLYRVVDAAVEEFKTKTGNCIEWKYYSPSSIKQFTNYVSFYRGRGCWSYIGRQQGMQRISLGRGCDSKGIAIHEMMHALGFFHEQSRRDRDKYIKINWDSIPKGVVYNFKMYQDGEADTLGEPYDKKSIMHYGNYAFTRDGKKTIVSITDPNEILGQRNGLSTIDVKQLKKYYKCVTDVSDAFPFCTKLKSYCEGSDKSDWVIKNCKFTCRDTVKKEEKKKKCENNNPTYDHNCDGWSKSEKQYCATGNYQSFMMKHCNKSCCSREYMKCDCVVE